MFQRIRAFVDGYKTYITAAIMLAGAIVAWAAGEIDGEAFVVAIYAALQAMFIRAGIAKTQQEVVAAADDVIKEMPR